LIACSSAAIGSVMTESVISGMAKVRHFGHVFAILSKALLNSCSSRLPRGRPACWDTLGLAGTDRAAVPHNAAPAEPYEYGAPEAVGLELYLMVRGRGMPIETLAVRP